MTLTKVHIVKAVTEQIGHTKKRSIITIETLLELIKRSLESGEDVLITELVTLSRIRPNFLDTDQIGDSPTSITSHFPFGVCAPRLVSLRHNCS